MKVNVKWWEIAYWVGFAAFLVLCFQLCAGCSSSETDHDKSCYHGCPQDTNDQPAPVVVQLPGKDGQSCTVTPVDGGSEITCGDSKTFVANGPAGTNGANGSDGAVGQTGAKGDTGDTGSAGKSGTDGKDSTPIVTLTLCGSTSPHAEIAIHMNNQWVAFFCNSDYTNGRLTTLVPNQLYGSTDGFQTCVFTTADLDARLSE